MKDLEMLQCPWTITSLEMEGQKMSPDMFAGAGIVVEGNRFKSTGLGFEYQGTLKLDESATPRRITMKFDAGPEKGNTNLAIYELKRDTWKLCIATRGAVRPARFKSTPGSGIA